MNKGYLNSVILIVAAFLLFFGTIDARGGGRGGGGRGGGARAGAGARPVTRAPTMSRANIPAARTAQRRPDISRPQMISAAKSRPSNQQIQRRLDGTSDTTRQALRQMASQSPRPAEVRTARQQELSHLKQSLPNTLSQRQNTAQQLRQRVDQANPNMRDMFTNQFWDKHRYNPPYGLAGANWWRRAGWGNLNGWLGWGWGAPYYYDSGFPMTVSSTDDTSYLASPSDSTVATVPGQNGQTQTTQSADWLPLGVFALVNNVKNPSDANMFFQLALGKDGTLAGAYYNKSADQVYPLEGIVDKDTQAAIWKMSVGEGSPVFKTGIYNLTKDETALQVTYGDDTEQNWLMVRL